MKIRKTFFIGALAAFAGCDSDVDMRVQVIVPAEVANIPSGVIRVQLFVYDPMLADAPAMLADMDSVRFSHVNGRTQTFQLLLEADVPGGQRHYISAEGFELTAQCERYVLWDGLTETAAPQVIVMQPVPQPGCFGRAD